MQAWLSLSMARGLSVSHVDKLVEKFGSAEAVVDAKPADLANAGVSVATAGNITAPDQKTIERCESWLGGDRRHHLLTRSSSSYPELLRHTRDAPLVLFAKGDVRVLSLPTFAIVGSRNATIGGRDTAASFANHLAVSGFCIASGLAIGIDAAAHQAALRAAGKTVAVCATGLDDTYPPRHRDLAEAIADSGALLSEFPPGSPPRRHQFPQRNRIISGISVGTLVVEAGLRSGALITARLASEQGREVFAIPGSIHNPLAKGCHRLIRNGAKLVDSAHDIIEELPGALGHLAAAIEQNNGRAAASPSSHINSEHERLLELMGWDPVSVNALVERSGLTTDEVSSMLLILELEERVDLLAGGRYQQREVGRQI